MLGLTFFALSPSVYMIRPQLTEQYGHVLRVSVVRASLKLRVSANAAVGEKPNATRLDPTSPAPLTRKNCLRFISIQIGPPPVRPASHDMKKRPGGHAAPRSYGQFAPRWQWELPAVARWVTSMERTRKHGLEKSAPA